MTLSNTGTLSSHGRNKGLILILVTRVSKYLCYLCPCGDRKTSLARLVLFPIEIGISNFVQQPASNGAIASTIRKGWLFIKMEDYLFLVFYSYIN